jgi:hypothetical protein
MRTKVSLTDDELNIIVSALCSWGDQLAEMANDKELKHGDDLIAKEWAEREGHHADRLYWRMQCFAVAEKIGREQNKGKLKTLTKALLAAMNEYDNLTITPER